MTKRQFLETYRYELAGLVLEASMHPRSGQELAMSLRPLFARIDGLLDRVYEAAAAGQLEPPKPPPPSPPPAKQPAKPAAQPPK